MGGCVNECCETCSGEACPGDASPGTRVEWSMGSKGPRILGIPVVWVMGLWVLRTSRKGEPPPPPLADNS